jgi:hypothetical protein
MKNFLCLFGALALALTSCSSDDESSENLILPKTITYKYSAVEGDNDKAVVLYNGNKIVSASYSASDKEVYTYTGDLITKIEDFASEGNISSKNEFTYENGKLKIDLLIEIAGDKTYTSKTLYNHNNDGTISYVTYSDINTIDENKISEGVLTYSGGNLVKKTENYKAGSSYVKTYEYDTKNNPFKNILGYNLLIDYDTTVNLNNVTKMTNIYNNGESNGSTNVFIYTYGYNDKEYPVKQVETNSFNDGEDTTEYTY